MTGGHDQFHDTNVVSVIDKMMARSVAGQKTHEHDTTRDDFNLETWLVNTQEELMDAVIYIEATLTRLRETAV